MNALKVINKIWMQWFRWHFLASYSFTLCLPFQHHNLDHRLPNGIVQNDKITIKLTNRFVASRLCVFSTLSTPPPSFSISWLSRVIFQPLFFIVPFSNGAQHHSALDSSSSVWRRFSFRTVGKRLSSLASNQSVARTHKHSLIKRQTINFRTRKDIELLVDWCWRSAHRMKMTTNRRHTLQTATPI